MEFKICNRCDKELPIDRFERYSGERGIRNLRSSRTSYCKKCRSELRLKNLLRKKKFIINSTFNGKCCECDTGILFLPSLEFHHQIPDLKTTVWTHIKHYSISNIKNWIEREKVIVLCSNCHEMKKEKYFREFQNVILRNNLFDYSPEEIDEMINTSINTHPKYSFLKAYKRTIKIQIKMYIRKRFVLDKIFGGVCVGCNKTNIYDSLPILELHHLSQENLVRKSKWRDLANNQCNSIISQIIMEKCICLCSNCHILVRSKLVNYADDIFEDPLIRTDFIKNYYKIITNIKKFKYPINIVESSPPLELKFSQNEFWKIHFMKISIILQNHKKHYFTVVDLANLLHQDQRSIRYYLDRLVSMELLNKTQENAFPFENTYRITEEGRNILEKLKELHQKTYKELKNDIFSMDDYMERQNRWTL